MLREDEIDSIYKVLKPSGWKKIIERKINPEKSEKRIKEDIDKKRSKIWKKTNGTQRGS